MNETPLPVDPKRETQPVRPIAERGRQQPDPVERYIPEGAPTQIQDEKSIVPGAILKIFMPRSPGPIRDRIIRR
jgi:hypothetical protein